MIEPRGGPICAVEVKAAATLSSRDSKGLRSLASTLGTETARLAPKVWAMPVSALWAGRV